MSYQVKFTETGNPAKQIITVEDQTLNQETAVTFVGKNFPGYGSYIAENFLHLMENFANNTPPSNPVQGQLWFDNSAGENQLKVWDSTTWSATGGIKKSSSAPTNPNAGDLWSDTANQQLKFWNGATWILVGPQFSAGVKTGPEIELITDLTDSSNAVITLWVGGTRTAIVSSTTFTPKSTISGFKEINKGINLSSLDATSTTSPIKYWGTAQKANALVVGTASVDAANFLRSDKETPSSVRFSIRTNDGLQIGNDLSFVLRVDDGKSTLWNKTSGSSIDFKITNNDGEKTVVRIDSSERVGINKTDPQHPLDVAGNIRTDSQVLVTGTQDATTLSSGSINTLGGAVINKSLRVGVDARINGVLYVDRIDGTSTPIVGAALLPGSLEAGSLYDIGSEARKFRNVYAEYFYGNFNGTFAGTLGGSTVAGAASKLVQTTTFNMSGDVSSDGFAFNGQTVGGTSTFTTILSSNLITNKAVLEDPVTFSTKVLATDEILIYRPDTVGLKKTTKEKFLDGVALVPVGAIMPYAGATAPSGYLLCDGSEVSKSTYTLLYSKIGDIYKGAGSLVGAGTFKLPDLRGRFPLGKDNMDNTTLPDITTQDSVNSPVPILVNAGGGAANRVTETAASSLGSGSGTATKTLTVNNLPEHKHTMKGASNGQFGALGDSTLTDADSVPIDGLGGAANGARLLKNSGGVQVTSGSLGSAVNVMNPYLTINYIIYTGVTS
jgi:microcystin-dependent protein